MSSDILLKRQATNLLPDPPEGSCRLLVNVEGKLILVDEDRVETEVGSGGGGGDSEPLLPVDIEANTLLTAVDHANRDLRNNTTNDYTLTLQTDANSGCNGAEAFGGPQNSTGTLTILAADGVTLRAPNSTLAVTTGVGTFVGAVRTGPNTYTLTEKSVSSGGGSSADSYGLNGFASAERVNNSSISFGGLSFSEAGTPTARSLATTNIVTKTLRAGRAGAASAHTQVGLALNSTAVCVDARPQKVRAVFNIADAIASGRKIQFGYIKGAGQGLDSGQEPNNEYYGSRAILAARSTDSQFVFVTNDEAGVAVVTVLNGGTGFPCNDPTQLYEFTLEYIPTGPRRFVMTLKNLGSGISVSQTFTTKIPSASEFYDATFKCSSGANAAAPALDFSYIGFGKFA